MKKYERFILNLLAFSCCTLQVLLVLSAISLVIGMLSMGSFQEVYQYFGETIALKHSMLSLPSALFYLLIVSIIQGILMFSYLNYVRNLLHNLNDEIYFEESNLRLFKKVLIYYGATAIMEAFVAIFNKINHVTLLTRGSSENYIYLLNGLLTMMGIYVIYMVFKHGVRLKKESDAFI